MKKPFEQHPTEGQINHYGQWSYEVEKAAVRYFLRLIYLVVA